MDKSNIKLRNKHAFYVFTNGATYSELEDVIYYLCIQFEENPVYAINFFELKGFAYIWIKSDIVCDAIQSYLNETEEYYSVPDPKWTPPEIPIEEALEALTKIDDYDPIEDHSQKVLNWSDDVDKEVEIRERYVHPTILVQITDDDFLYCESRAIDMKLIECSYVHHSLNHKELFATAKMSKDKEVDLAFKTEFISHIRPYVSNRIIDDNSVLHGQSYPLILFNPNAAADTYTIRIIFDPTVNEAQFIKLIKYSIVINLGEEELTLYLNHPKKVSKPIVQQPSVNNGYRNRNSDSEHSDDDKKNGFVKTNGYHNRRPYNVNKNRGYYRTENCVASE